MNIVFLCSGSGGNLKFLQAAIGLGLLGPARIGAVVADRDCPALGYAASLGVPSWIGDFSAVGQQRLATDVQPLRPDVVVTNVHRILGPAFLQAFGDKLVNLHYSLLPAFGGVIGTKPLEQAIAYGVKWVGATAHRVSEAVDGGRPLCQAVLPLYEQDDVGSVMDTLFRAGCLALLSAVRMQSGAGTAPAVGVGTFQFGGRPVLVNPAPLHHDQLLDEAFWAKLKA